MPLTLLPTPRHCAHLDRASAVLAVRLGRLAGGTHGCAGYARAVLLNLLHLLHLHFCWYRCWCWCWCWWENSYTCPCTCTCTCTCTCYAYPHSTRPRLQHQRRQRPQPALRPWRPRASAVSIGTTTRSQATLAHAWIRPWVRGSGREILRNVPRSGVFGMVGCSFMCACSLKNNDGLHCILHSPGWH